jgi:hypothetical protein
MVHRKARKWSVENIFNTTFDRNQPPHNGGIENQTSRPEWASPQTTASGSHLNRQYPVFQPKIAFRLSGAFSDPCGSDAVLHHIEKQDIFIQSDGAPLP